MHKNIFTYLFSKLKAIANPRNKRVFLISLPKGAKILDVGCGGNFAKTVKKFCDDSYYVGVDVQTYNLDDEAKNAIDEFIVTDGEGFADTIRDLPQDFDAVICSHNIEHCNHPMETIDAFCSRLKPGGRLFLSFPSEASVTFPSRKGTLNFYDDDTHSNVPELKAVMKRLISNNRMSVDYVAAQYRPFIGRTIGMIQNLLIKDRVTIFIWYYYGFETMIWAHKK